MNQQGCARLAHHQNYACKTRNCDARFRKLSSVTKSWRDDAKAPLRKIMKLKWRFAAPRTSLIQFSFVIDFQSSFCLHAYRVWGAVIFWGEISLFFLLLLVLTCPAVVRRRRVLVLD